MPDILDFITADAVGRLIAALIGAVVGSVIRWFFKRNRLRSAIRIEVSLLTDNVDGHFSGNKRQEFIDEVKFARGYLITMSKDFVVLDNLSDDIAYVSKDTAKKIIVFAYNAKILANAIALLNSETFNSYNADDKEVYVKYVLKRYDKFKSSSGKLLDVL